VITTQQRPCGRLVALECPSGIGRNALISQDPSATNEFDGGVNTLKNAGRIRWKEFGLLPVHLNLVDGNADASAFLNFPRRFKSAGVLT
jgi:hypothetical protein